MHTPTHPIPTWADQVRARLKPPPRHPRHQIWAAAGALALLTIASAAHATGFKVIATLGDSPAIGAIHGTTLYGTTLHGGDSNGDGTLFSLTTSGTYTLLRTLDGATDGSNPNRRLAIDSSGAVYGTAQYGGQYGGGTLWKFAGTTFSTLHALGNAGDGAIPLQGPTIDSAGALFDSAAGGAINTNGSTFRYTAAGKYKSLHNFLSETDGHCPFSGVARNKAGTVFGTAVGMGFGGNPIGSVFQITAKGVFSTIYVFRNGTDGEYPDQAPALDGSGNLYGTTFEQNDGDFPGALWKITTTNSFSVLHSFAAATDGYGPNSPLLLNTDGNLYGTTSSGGPGGYGTVYSITPSGNFTMLHAFADGTDGANPTGNLVHDGAGAIFGGTGSGQVFEVAP